METTYSFYDPEDLFVVTGVQGGQEKAPKFKLSPHQESSVLKFSEPTLFHDGTSIHSLTNTGLILENIKQEVESINFKRTPGSQSAKECKIEEGTLIESGEMTFVDFASLLDSALQGIEDPP